MTLLSLKGVTAGYGGRPVIAGIDLDLAAGGAAAILGVNGAGKTTLLRAISGLIPATGDIRLDGRPIAGLRPEEIARRGVAHVPEGRGTFAGLSVEENLRIGAAASIDRRGVAAELDRVFALFPQLADRRRQIAGTMSGGEQQMLAIGRGLMMRPRLLLLDEPSFGLAPMIVARLVAALATVRREGGLALLLVEQNLVALGGLVDDVHVIGGGRIALSAKPDDPQLSALLRQAYLG